MQITIISKEEDFLGLKERWNSLLLESGLDNIFLTWEWLYNWWKVFKSRKDELFILMGVEDSTILGIAPCYIRKNFCKEICFLGAGIVYSDYLSVIVAKKDRINFLQKILTYLDANSYRWDLLRLSSLESNDEIIPIFREYSNSKRWLWVKLKEYPSFYLPLPQSWDIFSSSLSANRIKKMSYKIRKLTQQGQFECKELVFSNQEDLLSNFETIVSFHQKRWQRLENKIAGLFSNKLFLEFLTTVSEVLYKNNWLSIYGVLLNDRLIAADYNLKFNKKIFCYVGTFNPIYEHYSPGLVCFWESLKLYINNGYQEYDFLKGDETYKNRWTDKSRKELDILVVKKDLKGVLFLLCYKTITFVKKIFKKILPNKLLVYLRAFKFNRSR